MSPAYPHFQINFKVYPGTWGEDGLALAETIERVSEETGANFVVTPQVPDVRLIARETDLPVFAPAVDPAEPGRGMGKLLPEALAEAGAVGAIINHAENRDTLADIETKIDRCQAVGLETVVCVDSVETGRAVAAFELGVDATGAASAIATAEDPEDRLREIGEVVADRD